jgi:hypothetical protein
MKKNSRATIRDPVGFNEDEITWAEPEGVFRQPDTSIVFTHHNDLNNRKSIRKPVLLAREPEPQLPGVPDMRDPNPHARLEQEERQARLGSGLKGVRLADAPEMLGPGLDLGYDNVGRDALQDLYVPEVRNIDETRGRRVLPHNLENATPSQTVPWRCDANDSLFRPLEPAHIRRNLIVEPGTYKRAAQELINTGSDRSLREALKPTHKTTTARASQAQGVSHGEGGTHKTAQVENPTIRDNARQHTVKASSGNSGVRPAEAMESGTSNTGVSSTRPPVTLRPEKVRPSAVTEEYAPQQTPSQQPSRARISTHIKGREVRVSQLGGASYSGPIKQGPQTQAAGPEEIIRVRPERGNVREGMAAPIASSSKASTKQPVPEKVERIHRVRDPEAQTGTTQAPIQKRSRSGRDLSKKKRTPVEAMGVASGPQRNSRHSTVAQTGNSRAASTKQKIGTDYRFSRGNQYELLESSSNLDEDDDTERYAYYTR